MPVDLVKGQRISLDKEVGGRLSRVVMGLGWDVAKRGGFLGGLFGGGDSIDLDASCVMFDEAGRAVDTIYYAQLQSRDGSVIHTGDNLTGEGEGDDEQIKVDLSRVPQDVANLAVGVTIHEADTRRQNFGMVSNAFIRVVNGADNSEIARYDLSEDASTETAMVFGEVYRRGNEWKFKAVGQGFQGGLGPLARNYGVNV